MNTVPELLDAYRDLADHAPGVADLQLTPPTKHRPALRPMLAALVAVLAVVGLVVYLRGHAFGKNEPPANRPQPRWPDSYQFGPDALPGYTFNRTDMQVLPRTKTATTTYEYTQRGANLRGTLKVLRTAELDGYRNGTPVTVNGKPGYYLVGSSTLPPQATRPASIASGAPPANQSSPPLVRYLSRAIVWAIGKDSWAVLNVGIDSFSYVDDKLTTPINLPSQATMVRLAESVRPHESATTAPVKIGYLPAGLRLTYVEQNQDGPLNTYDNRFGRSYRDLMFTDRSVGQSEQFSLDIGGLVAPQKPLTLKNLPDARTIASGEWSPSPYDPAKQWTQRTIAGHRAFVSAHSVIIDWGGVEVHVTNQNYNFTVTPVLSRAELIRIAASLTVPSSGTVGNGYPISQAVPAANRQ